MSAVNEAITVVTKIENVAKTEAEAVVNKVESEIKVVEGKASGYVTTFEQDAKSFEESSRGWFRRFLAFFGF